MIRTLLFLGAMLAFFVSCKKERFENTGHYSPVIKLYIVEDGDTLSKFSTLSGYVELRNETKHSIQYIGNVTSSTDVILDKSGRKLSGYIYHSHFGVPDTDSAFVTMKRDVLGKNIEGTVEARSFFSGKYWDSEGTITLEYIN